MPSVPLPADAPELGALKADVEGYIRVSGELATDLEKAKEALNAWMNACQVDALMEGPVARVSYIRAQPAFKLTAELLSELENGK